MSTGPLRHRPILGGIFGAGRYALATMPCISRGLHAVRYMVIEPRAGSVLSVSEDKRDALAAARRLLRAATALANREGARQQGEQVLLWPDEKVVPITQAGAQPRVVSRRRREVFERSSGLCHYCGTTLTLDGKWHVEHMLPRAIGGDDDPVNLVASCVACNLAKRDRTALEFLARQAPGKVA